MDKRILTQEAVEAGLLAQTVTAFKAMLPPLTAQVELVVMEI